VNNLAKSLRTIAKEAGIDHSALSKVARGKYKANPKGVIDKLLKSIGGVNIPTDKLEEILQMLNKARFPVKFQEAHRTAAWLYEIVSTANKGIKNEKE